MYSLSPGTSDLDKAREVAPFVNMYRLTDDVWDNPKKFVDGEMQPLEFVFGSGMAGAKGLNGKSWPDMDMLPVGYIGSQDESGPKEDAGGAHWRYAQEEAQRTR